VTFEALLTFFGILVAILAIARPVQRASIKLFVSTWLWVLVGAILLCVALIVCRDAPLGWRPIFGWSLSGVMFGLTFGAFAFPGGGGCELVAFRSTSACTSELVETARLAFHRAAILALQEQCFVTGFWHSRSLEFSVPPNSLHAKR
jgi:hypothetical protein